MEFTQLLRIGLGLVEGHNPHYSPPMFTGKHSNTHATINETQEQLWNTGNLLENNNAGIIKMWECENHVNNVKTRQTDHLQGMTSQKQIT